MLNPVDPQTIGFAITDGGMMTPGDETFAKLQREDPIDCSTLTLAPHQLDESSFFNPHSQHNASSEVGGSIHTSRVVRHLVGGVSA